MAVVVLTECSIILFRRVIWSSPHALCTFPSRSLSLIKKKSIFLKNVFNLDRLDTVLSSFSITIDYS